MKRPKAFCAYRYGPPVRAKREATSAKQPMITAIATAASTTARMLARPTRLVKTEGRPKTPLPMMQFTVRAARLQRPIARTNPSLERVSMALLVIASLYHRYMTSGSWRARRLESTAFDEGRCAIIATMFEKGLSDEGATKRFHSRRNWLYGTEIDSATAAAWARCACSSASRLRGEAAAWV